MAVAAAMLVIAAAVVGFSISGDGGGSSVSSGTGGLPDSGTAALTRNAEQGDEIVGEGIEAFEQRLADLNGHPVVVNQWASWCTSCRFEFPFFRDAVERHGDRVAFLGLDSQDERGAAEEFLEEFPVGFPSIFDPDASVAASIGAGRSWPTTVFFDAEGERVHVKLGAYSSLELLEEDIRRYALAREA